VHRRVGGLLSVVLVASLVSGCRGHSRRLGDGQWYGKLIAVNVAHRRLTFAPACSLNESGRWIVVPASSRVQDTATIAHPDLEIYFRPSGSVVAGHGQGVHLAQLAPVASHGQRPDFPPGWFVTVRDGAAVSVYEDSGIRSSGEADKRTFACVWSPSTQAFVSN
jgi:hypothetical protein